jgi:hypothetical protein
VQVLEHDPVEEDWQHQVAGQGGTLICQLLGHQARRRDELVAGLRLEEVRAEAGRMEALGKAWRDAGLPVGGVGDRRNLRAAEL